MEAAAEEAEEVVVAGEDEGGRGEAHENSAVRLDHWHDVVRPAAA